MNDIDRRWIDHKCRDTYRIASYIQAITNNPVDYLRDLEELILDFGILEFVPHWRKDTTLHKFARFITDLVFHGDNDGSVKIPFPNDDGLRRWTLPIEFALVSYGIQDSISFEIPEIPMVKVVEGNTTSYHDAPELFDKCSEYFAELRWTEAYESLLHKIGDEVFFVMFTNRAMLQNLHQYLSHHVIATEYLDCLRAEHPETARYYTKSGRMKRTAPPAWARRAIYYRDRGLCTKCRRDLSGLINPFNVQNFDHIVPLANGGLNDVTNLQLLCEECNKRKSSLPERTSISYQRWFF